jgi:hypothetical protein
MASAVLKFASGVSLAATVEGELSMSRDLTPARRGALRVVMGTSEVGTFETCRPSVTVSASGGKPEVIEGKPNRRD